jgi:hypothetical protein
MGVVNFNATLGGEDGCVNSGKGSVDKFNASIIGRCIMSNEYTRQRQGRDFSLLNYLASTEMSVEGNYNNIIGIVSNSDLKEDSEKKRSLLDQLEQYKAEAERNVIPIEGYELPERGR